MSRNPLRGVWPFRWSRRNALYPRLWDGIQACYAPLVGTTGALMHDVIGLNTQSATMTGVTVKHDSLFIDNTGSTEYRVELPDTWTIPNIAGQVSIALDLRMNTDGDTDGRIIAKQADWGGGADSHDWMLSQYTNSTFRLRLVAGATNDTIITSDYVYDGTGYERIFVCITYDDPKIKLWIVQPSDNSATESAVTLLIDQDHTVGGDLSNRSGSDFITSWGAAQSSPGSWNSETNMELYATYFYNRALEPEDILALARLDFFRRKSEETLYFRGFEDAGAGLQTITATGIASAEAFGSAALAPGSVAVSPTGLASGEAFGTAALSSLYAIVATAVATGEAHGASVVTPGAVAITPTGVATGEAHGASVVAPGSVAIAPTGITTAEAFGAAVIDSLISLVPTGISTGEAFGGATVSTGTVTLSPTGIATDEALGSHSVTQGLVLAPSGIASAEAFGSASFSTGGVSMSPTGVASAEAFGSAVVAPGAVSISPSGVASVEAFGTAAVVLAGIVLSPTGIASAEAFGSASLTTGAVTISATGIATSEAFGTAAVATGSVIILPNGIATAEAHGSQVVVVGATVIQPTGIVSSEAFGSVTIVGGADIVGWLTAVLGATPALASSPTAFPAVAGSPGVNDSA